MKTRNFVIWYNLMKLLFTPRPPLQVRGRTKSIKLCHILALTLVIVLSLHLFLVLPRSPQKLVRKFPKIARRRIRGNGLVPCLHRRECILRITSPNLQNKRNTQQTPKFGNVGITTTPLVILTTYGHLPLAKRTVSKYP